MDNEVRLPIKTVQKGDEISKVCVEDCYKIVNRVVQSMDKAYNNSIDILDSIHKKYDGYEGSYCCYNQSACSEMAYGHYINYRCIQTCTNTYYGQ